MKEGLVPCRYCKCKAAEPYSVDGLYYVRCKGTRKINKKIKNKDGTITHITETKKCAAWSPYEFLGTSAKAAINNWNERNSGKTIEEE